MSPLPRFHTKATKEAEARSQAARGEVEKASSFLEELDDILAPGAQPTESE